MLGVLAILIVEFAIISLAMGQGQGPITALSVPPAPFNPVTALSLPDPASAMSVPSGPVPCTCGVFLSGQFTRGSSAQPNSPPVLLHEYDNPFPCSPVGARQCANKCLEVIAKHLRNSPTIICGALDRDCFKERAYLWTKNCNDVWVNSNMSAGREFCCKDGVPYKCPVGNRV